MLSLFYKALEIRTLKGANLTIFKPNTGQQVILIKGKLGQYKFDWACSLPSQDNEQEIGEAIKEIGTWANKRQTQGPSAEGSEVGSTWNTRPTIKIFGAGSPQPAEEQGNIAGSEPKKLFVFNQKTKKIADIVLLTSAHLSEKSLKDEINNEKIEFPENVNKKNQNQDTKNFNVAAPRTFLQAATAARGTDKIYIGEFTEPGWAGHEKQNNNALRSDSAPWNNADKEESSNQSKLKSEAKENLVLTLAGRIRDKLNIRIGEILNEQIKNMMIGVTQGFTISLELEGIGYQAKIEKLNEDALAKKQQNGNKTDKEELQSKKGEAATDEPSNIWNSDDEPKNQKQSKSRRVNERLYGPGGPQGTSGTSLYSVFNIKGRFSEKRILRKGQAGQKQKKTYSVLSLALGQSHKIIYPLYNKDVTASVIRTDPVTISLFGISRSIVNQVAAEIYLYKKPEPYKGKGIRYNGEKFFAKKKKR